MPGRGPKNKGSGYERELAAYLNDVLFGGRAVVSRAPLSGGGRLSLESGGSDLLGLLGLFVEAKRVERLDFRGALRQAQGNALARQTPDLPLVVARRSREKVNESVVVVQLDAFLEIYKAWLRSKGIEPEMVVGPLFVAAETSDDLINERSSGSLSDSIKTTGQL